MTGPMKKLAGGVCAGMLALGVTASADEAPQQPTFFKDVLPILQDNCQDCHRPSGANLSGMVAPMSLMDYNEVRPWAKAVAKVVQNREMPPWFATPETSHNFSNERTLTETEIATLVTWVNQGAKRGNPADAPEPKQFSDSGWNFGEPDLVINFDEPFFVEDEVEDLYQNITVKLTKDLLPEDKWIKAIEYKPGSEVVHHIIGYASMPGGEEDRRTTRGMLGGNAPGSEQGEYPGGYGMLLKSGSEVTFQMHYHKEPGPGTGQYDSSQIGLQFHDEPVAHPVTITNIDHGSFEIPPNHSNWKVGASMTFDEDTHLLGLMPHMHLRGKAARYTAYYPDGDTELLLEVPKYDFNWQTSYHYKERKLIPAGTRIEMEFWYENTPERAELAGIDPNRAISFGGPTTDEMDLAWITIAPAEAMDVAEAKQQALEQEEHDEEHTD